MYTALQIKNVSLSHSGNYAYVTGSVRNNGRRAYDFVKVRAALKDRYGNVIDTDWTYAAGSEGLRPGEETTFKMMIKDSTMKIQSVSVQLME